MKKKIAILQSNYIPWKGYFDIIKSVDEFIIYDDVQYTKNDWRNRNRVKSPNGSVWLTIPTRQVTTNQTIRETKIADPKWGIKHWRTLRQYYAQAKHYREISKIFEPIFNNIDTDFLSLINHRMISEIMNYLSIDTKLTWSYEYPYTGGKSEKLVSLCKLANATHYLSGPAAKTYLNTQLFFDNNIIVEWADYSNYPEYNQSFPPFDHAVSIMDLLFCHGRESNIYMKTL